MIDLPQKEELRPKPYQLLDATGELTGYFYGIVHSMGFCERVTAITPWDSTRDSAGMRAVFLVS